MLETIREYALERLVDSGEQEVLQRRHAGYFAALAETRPDGNAQQHRVWFDSLEQEHANFRAALGWSRTEASGETGWRLSAGLFLFWRDRGYLREGYHWMVEAVTPRAAALAAAPPSRTQQVLRARALDAVGVFAQFLGELERAQLWLEESLALYRELGMHAEIAEVLSDLGMVFQEQGDFARAGAHLEASLRRYRELGDDGGVGWSLFFLGTLAYSEGHTGRAGELLDESLRVLSAAGDRGTAPACWFIWPWWPWIRATPSGPGPTCGRV